VGAEAIIIMAAYIIMGHRDGLKGAGTTQRSPILRLAPSPESGYDLQGQVQGCVPTVGGVSERAPANPDGETRNNHDDARWPGVEKARQKETTEKKKRAQTCH
jgi:hypothetical protein